jgi:hypothetical protein
VTAYALEVAREVAVQEEAERAAVEVARMAQAFPYAPKGVDRLLGPVREITAGQDPAEVMIALGALTRRGIERALDDGRDDEVTEEESDRFVEGWLDIEQGRIDRRTRPERPSRWGRRQLLSGLGYLGFCSHLAEFFAFTAISTCRSCDRRQGKPAMAPSSSPSV